MDRAPSSETLGPSNLENCPVLQKCSSVSSDLAEIPYLAIVLVLTSLASFAISHFRFSAKLSVSDPVLAIPAQMVLILTSATLFYVALTDLKHFTIKNELIVLLAVLFFIYAVLSGQWTQLYWNIGFAILMFFIMLYFYSQKLMGGGDLKLLAVAFLWTGPLYALPFAIVLAALACIHIVLVKFGWASAQRTNGSTRIPLAPSIAGSLIVLFAATPFLEPHAWGLKDLLGCLTVRGCF